MTGIYVPLDANYQEDPKILRAGALAELLHIRGLALCKRLLTDGVIETVQLGSLTVGLPGKLDQHLAALERERLWERVECGWRIVSWTKRNKTRAQIEEDRERRKVASVKANHERWHTFKQSESCPLCLRNASDIGSDSGPQSDPTETETEAVASGLRNGRPLFLPGSGVLREFAS